MYASLAECGEKPAVPDDARQPVDTDESTPTDTDTDDGSTSELPRLR